MSKTLRRSRSSGRVSRSISSVARPASPSSAATWRLRGLWRPLPLPWAKITSPPEFAGRRRSPGSRTPPVAGISTDRAAGASGGGSPAAVDATVADAARSSRSDDLRVGGLAEVAVPRADSAQVRRHLQAHHLVRLGPQALDRLSRADRDGEHHAACAARADGAQRRARRAAGRQAVVHDDRRASCELDRRPAAAVALELAREFGRRPFGRAVELLDADHEGADRVTVQDPHATLGDRSHPELGIPGRTDLADQQHIERRLEGARDLVGDGHAPAWQREHDRFLGGDAAQRSTEGGTRLAAVPEDAVGDGLSHGHNAVG